MLPSIRHQISCHTVQELSIRASFGTVVPRDAKQFFWEQAVLRLLWLKIDSRSPEPSYYTTMFRGLNIFPWNVLDSSSVFKLLLFIIIWYLHIWSLKIFSITALIFVHLNHFWPQFPSVFLIRTWEIFVEFGFNSVLVLLKQHIQFKLISSYSIDSLQSCDWLATLMGKTGCPIVDSQ